MTKPMIAYNFAILRVVPNVAIGNFVNVGVILHARTASFLDMEVICDAARLQTRIRDVDIDLLCRYLDSCRSIARGDADAGAVALLPTSERFHWLTAPRSDVIQSSPVHEGMCEEPAAELAMLFKRYVPE
jgi:hypothetical protein